MAYEQPLFNLTGLKAAADLSAKQYYFVKLSAAGTVNVCSAVTDVPIGVLQNAPTSGKEAEVMCIGVSKVSSDEALSVADIIGVSSDSQAQVLTVGSETTVRILGQVLTATTAAGGVASALINCAATPRAT